jgi:hypothetical protein
MGDRIAPSRFPLCRDSVNPSPTYLSIDCRSKSKWARSAPGLHWRCRGTEKKRQRVSLLSCLAHRWSQAVCPGLLGVAFDLELDRCLGRSGGPGQKERAFRRSHSPPGTNRCATGVFSQRPAVGWSIVRVTTGPPRLISTRRTALSRRVLHTVAGTVACCEGCF